MDGFTWTATARVSVSGLPGWLPVERVEVAHHGSRALVRIERLPVDPGMGIDALAEAHGDSVRVQGWTDSGSSTAPVLGTSDGRVRTVAYIGEDGERQRAVLRYALDRDTLVVVTAVTPDGDAVLEHEAAVIAASVLVRAPWPSPEAVLPLRPGQVALDTLAEAWLTGVPNEVAAQTAAAAAEHRITNEESFAAAQHYGVAMLPGADSSQWNQLDESERELVATVAWRSLEARGAAGGTDLAEAMELAASHDLIVLVSARRGDEVSWQWFAARPDRMVRLRPQGHGLMALTTHHTADLAVLVLEEHAPGVAYTASAVYRSEGHVIGDETAWSGEATASHVRAALAGLVTSARTRSSAP